MCKFWMGFGRNTTSPTSSAVPEKTFGLPARTARLPRPKGLEVVPTEGRPKPACPDPPLLCAEPTTGKYLHRCFVKGPQQKTASRLKSSSTTSPTTPEGDQRSQDRKGICVTYTAGVPPVDSLPCLVARPHLGMPNANEKHGRIAARPLLTQLDRPMSADPGKRTKIGDPSWKRLKGEGGDHAPFCPHLNW